MDIRFTGKNMKVTKGIKEHLTDRVGKLDKYAPRIVESHVMLKKEKYLYHVQITLLGKNLRAVGEASEKDNVYAAIDQAALRVTKQLKKFREKIKDHRKEHGPRAVSPKVRISSMLSEIPDITSLKPSIVRVTAASLRPMSVDEASLKLEVETQPFILFINEKTRKPNVLFKKDDGNHGHMQP